MERDPRMQLQVSLLGQGSIANACGRQRPVPSHLAQIWCTDLQTFFLGPLNPRVAPCPKQIVDGILEMETRFNIH